MKTEKFCGNYSKTRVKRKNRNVLPNPTLVLINDCKSLAIFGAKLYYFEFCCFNQDLPAKTYFKCFCTRYIVIVHVNEIYSPAQMPKKITRKHENEGC